jgi:putative peptidoglycan lipid II flippase
LGGIAVVNQAMAATLGPGSVSTLALANRATGLLLTIGPSALMIAGLPRLAKMVALHQWAALRRITIHLMLVSMLTASVLSIVLFVLSKPIVRVLFQGDHFTAADTVAVAHLQALSVLQLPFAVGSAILARILVLLQLKKLLIYISASSVLLGLLLNYVFMKPYGLSGIAIATVVGQALVLIVLIVSVSRHLRQVCRQDLSPAPEETFSEL